MLRRQFVRENPDAVRAALEQKGVAVDLDQLLEIDAEWRSLKSEGDDLRHERNEVSSEIGQLKAEGKDAEAEQAIERSAELKEELGAIEARADELEAELEAALLTLPQLPDDSVPVGADESENVERRREGFDDRRELPDAVEPHYDLGEELEILDFDRGAKVSGGGFYFAKGDGARLEHALIQFMLELHREQGYTDIFPPLPVNSTSMRGTGQFPKFTEDAYRIEGDNSDPYDDDDLWLLPTAEVPVTNLHRDEILLDDDLPLKYQAYSPNFRQEAGEHGTETRGIVRVHQFNKVELVNFVRPRRARSDSRDLWVRPNRCCRSSDCRTGSWRCVPAILALRRRKSTISKSGLLATIWRVGPMWAVGGWRFRRSQTSGRFRPGGQGFSTDLSSTSRQSICTRSTVQGWRCRG
jgi:seryl-tRNA synthetase (EC 6.1.1.11)